jgi:hypothetical protein
MQLDNIIQQLEEVFQSRYIGLTIIVLVKGCQIDYDELEKHLLVNQFPVGHHLFIIRQNDFMETFTVQPDLVFVVQGNNYEDQKVVMHAQNILNTNGIILMF